MSQEIVIAKKEFLDLLNSRLVLLALLLYTLILLPMVYAFFTGNTFGSDRASTFLHILTLSLCYYGSLIAIAVGLSSISEELDRKSINTLLVKPVYRDTIINGKIMGMIGFTLCITLFTTLIYIIILFVIFGNSINIYILNFLGKLPFVFILSILCFIFFFALTLLICINIREPSLAMLLSFLSWIFLCYLLPNVMFTSYFSSYISFILGDPSLNQYLQVTISDLSPTTMVFRIFLNITDNMSLIDVLDNNIFEILKLSLYCIITAFLAYISFIRRDIA